MQVAEPQLLYVTAACGSSDLAGVKMVDTYNADYPNGEGVAHGGYAGAIRVREDWVFKLPDEIDFKSAGPLQCAGITVYVRREYATVLIAQSPLKRNGCGPGKKVAIAGIGTLVAVHDSWLTV